MIVVQREARNNSSAVNRASARYIVVGGTSIMGLSASPKHDDMRSHGGDMVYNKAGTDKPARLDRSVASACSIAASQELRGKRR